MTAKSETVGVVAWQYRSRGNRGHWSFCSKKVFETFAASPDYETRAIIPLTDHESALAEATKAAEQWRELGNQRNDELTVLRAERQKLISGLEALAVEWHIQNSASGQGPAGNKARRKCAEQLRERIRALIPAAANTESEEGHGS